VVKSLRLSLAGAALATVFFVQPAAAAQAPFKLMVSVPLSAPSGNLPQVVAGVQAAAKAINSKGGLGGRPIAVTPCDTLGSLPGGQACARRAVEGSFDNVIEQSAFDIASRAILTAAGIPGIGTITNAANADPLSFPMVASAQVLSGSAGYMTKYAGCKRYVFTSVDLLITRQQAQIHRLSANKGRAGAFAGAVWFPLFTTDYASTAQQVKELNPDCVYLNNTNAGATALVRTLTQFGVNTKFIVSGAIFSPSVDAPNLPNAGEGVYFMTQLPMPAPASNSLLHKNFRKDMTAAGMSPTSTDITDPATLNGWTYTWGLKLLSTKVKGSVTRQSMIKAARTSRNIDVFGAFKWSPALKGPGAWPSVSNGLIFAQQLKGGKISPIKPFPFDLYKHLGYRR
jgi:branched-chain amino acid transport system substrate-binding protein